MKLLNKITTEAIQEFYLTGNPGPKIVMRMRFLPTQQIFMADFEYNGYVANGIAVVTAPNILRAFKNQLPFGIACVTDSGLDPTFVDQFANGTARLYLLTADEVETIEETLF